MNRIAEVESFSVIVPGNGDTNGSKKIWLPKSSTPKNVSLLEASIKWCLATLTPVRHLRMPMSLPWFETFVFIALIVGTRAQF